MTIKEERLVLKEADSRVQYMVWKDRAKAYLANNSFYTPSTVAATPATPGTSTTTVTTIVEEKWEANSKSEILKWIEPVQSFKFLADSYITAREIFAHLDSEYKIRNPISLKSEFNSITMVTLNPAHLITKIEEIALILQLGAGETLSPNQKGSRLIEILKSKAAKFYDSVTTKWSIILDHKSINHLEYQALKVEIQQAFDYRDATIKEEGEREHFPKEPFSANIVKDEEDQKPFCEICKKDPRLLNNVRSHTTAMHDSDLAKKSLARFAARQAANKAKSNYSLSVTEYSSMSTFLKRSS